MGKFLCSATRQAFCCVMAALLLMGCGGGGSTFTLKIEANPKSGGTVSPSGNIKYPVGTMARVTATAAEGYLFAGWSGASTDEGESATVTMNSNQTLTANFIKLKANPKNGGTVTSKDNVATATPNSGYMFAGWSGASDAKTRTVSVTMNSNQALTANFEKFTPTFTDSRDGKTYRRVQIGSLAWMAENLNFETSDSWCYEDNDGNCQKYGRLYDWDAAMKACPSEWRLPTREDWNDLFKAAGGNPGAGRKLKSSSPDWDGTDDFGFSALPGGYRGTNGSFYNAGGRGGWWSATEDGHVNFWRSPPKYESGDAWSRGMDSGLDSVGEGSNDKGLGLSVLCVQD